MMGGISSNAGLFANANDLAKVFQMYANYGEYGGKRYLKESTLREFTRCQYPENGNRRALGFDRPLPEPVEDGNTAKSVSQSSFGHSGFTGTYVWADPAYHLVYVFLSNRVYPTRENRKLYQFNTRTNIQEVVYEAINGSK
jgi:CubicO group peptidase (beta-lactamase class C family)